MISTGPSSVHSRRSVCTNARSSVVAKSLSFKLPPLFGGGANAKESQRQQKKDELLELIAPLKRGVNATEEDKQAVDAAARELEKLNPTPKPLASPLINGQWELLYTTSSSILGLNKPPFFRPSGPIFQIIDAEGLKARNTETAPFFNQVSANLEPVSVNKVAVLFQEFRIFNLIAIKAPPSARGELAFTYLDEDIRISRGDKGNLFVLRMADRSKKP